MLLHDGSPLPVRRVALAVLYYLALEGPTRRDALAKLLRAPGVDLHTELAQLEQELPNTGSSSLMTGTELLRLPPELIAVVDPRQRDRADPLEGLDDIANEFQAWLEWMRHYLVSSASWGLGAHAVRVAASLEPPYLLCVQPQPGDDVNAFARELAAALGEELRPAPDGEPGLYCPPRPYSDELVQHILHDPHSIYVLEMPPLGDIPAPIQELRKSYPRSHSRTVKLPPPPLPPPPPLRRRAGPAHPAPPALHLRARDATPGRHPRPDPGVAQVVPALAQPPGQAAAPHLERGEQRAAAGGAVRAGRPG